MQAPTHRQLNQQASEFGIVRGGQKLAALLAFITDVHALGLQTSQGLVMTEAWYWDLNDANREFAKKFAPQNKGIYPTMVHAGVYSAVTHYLKAVEALKSDADGKAVVAKMKELPTDDKLFGKHSARRRPQDPPDVPSRGEDAGGIQGSVGLLQGPRHHPGRWGVPPAVGWRLSAREQINQSATLGAVSGGCVGLTDRPYARFASSTVAREPAKVC